MDASRYQDFYTAAIANLTASTSASATTTGGALLPAKTNHTLFVQKISGDITGDDAATLTFVDSSTGGAAKTIAKTKASPGLGALVPFDFGPAGVPLTEGAGLDVTASAAGIGGTFHIEGYYKLTKGAAA